MATKKITITVEERQFDRVRELVTLGQASSVSGFVQHAIDLVLDDVSSWEIALGAALVESGGPLTAAERDWADEQLSPTPRQSESA